MTNGLITAEHRTYFSISVFSYSGVSAGGVSDHRIAIGRRAAGERAILGSDFSMNVF